MRSEAFARAYVATLFLLGDRGEALVEAAGDLAKSPLVRALTSDDRGRRAAGLASEMTRIALALDKGGIS